VRNILAKQSDIYKRVFATVDGRELLKELYRNYGRRPSFDAKSSRQTDYNEGQRSVYLKMIHLADIDPRKLERETEQDNG
jgi:hypothetical protein